MARTEASDDAGKFHKVSEIARLIHDSHDLTEILHRLAEGVCLHSSWASSSIQALDPARQTTTPIVRYDPYRPDAESRPEEWDAAGSPLTRIVETGQPLILEDASQQDKYTGFRSDALRRGYRTVVMIPLRFPDTKGRAIVFTVKSHEVVAVDDAEMGFLQCLADLADIAVRRMQILHREAKESQNLRDIIGNLTTALATSLDTEHTNDLFTVLSRLFPCGWFAIDLTAGRAIFDSAATPPTLTGMLAGPDETLIRQALRADAAIDGQDIRIQVETDTPRPARMTSLVIDGKSVGALFLLGSDDLTSHAAIGAQAGRFALSTLILRGYLAFQIRSHTAQRLMKRLFAGAVANHEELLEDAGLLGLDITGHTRLIAVSCSDRRDLDEGVHVYINRKAQQSFGAAISCIVDRKMFLLVRDTKDINDPMRRDEFLRSIQSVLARPPTIVRAEPITRMQAIGSAFDICKRNLKLAESMHAEGWVSGGVIGSFPTLMSSVSDAVAQEFLARSIEPIHDNGSPKGEVAIETLRTFLSSGRRLQETADSLGIHVSTLRYRLERLSERHDLDFTDSEKCFELELALRLHYLRNSYQT